MIKVAPSILSADFAEMGRAAENCESWGADYIHFDVMDGTFVPTITFGPQMCKAVRRHTKLPIDVHLMVEHPETYIPLFRDAGADIITFHIEADRHAHRTLQAIHNAGMRAGVVLNPSTSPEAVRYVISSCDMVLRLLFFPRILKPSYISTSGSFFTQRCSWMPRGVSLTSRSSSSASENIVLRPSA